MTTSPLRLWAAQVEPGPSRATEPSSSPGRSSLKRPSKISDNRWHGHAGHPSLYRSNTIDLRDGRITLDGRRVLFDGVESPIINGRGGNDTFKIISPARQRGRYEPPQAYPSQVDLAPTR